MRVGTIINVLVYDGRQIGFEVEFSDGRKVSFPYSHFVEMVTKEGCTITNATVNGSGKVILNETVNQKPYSYSNFFEELF